LLFFELFLEDQGKVYTPENYDGKYRGPVQLRFALGNSINVVAVKLLALVGVKNFLQKAYDMGITTFEPTKENLKRFGLSITLGGGEVRLLELTNAYTIFARGGEKLPYTYILEIKDFKGKTIYKKPKPAKVKVLDKSVAFLISHILSDNNARLWAFGPNSYLKIPGKTVAVKTGTTNDKRDNWTIGYTKDITIGVWVGNNDNSPMSKVASGITGASPIWHKLMRYALSNGWEDGIIEKPKNVVAVEIDAFLGGLPKEGFPTRVEYFIKGTEPKTVSPFYKKLKISKTTGKLANEYEIQTGNYEEKEFVVITENDPLSTDGKNRWQEAIDKWIEQQNDPIYKYPKEISDYKPKDTQILIDSPRDKEKIDSNTVEIKGKVISDRKIESLTIFVDEVKIFEGENTKEFEEIISLEKGVHNLRVVVKEEGGIEKKKEIKFGVKVKVEE
jgi:membrane peptidoglycan carboxypeptidase